MVSLDRIAAFRENISENPKLLLFYKVISRGLPKDWFDGASLQGVSDDFENIAMAILNSNEEKFRTAYSNKSRSKPSKEAPQPFVHDDYLIFLLVIGCQKFSTSKDWVQSVLSIRAKENIGTTFSNLLIGDFDTIQSNPAIYLVYSSLLFPEKIDSSTLQAAYQALRNGKSVDWDDNPFLYIMEFRAMEIVLENLGLVMEGELGKLREFESRFLKRTLWAGGIISTAILFVVIYVINSHFELSKKISEGWSPYLTFLPFLLAPIPLISKWLRKNVARGIQLILGHPRK